MGTVKLNEQQPNYLERPKTDPAQDMKRAREIVRADRKRRARFLIAAPGR
ncbi:MAG: hypothetical protein J0H70_15605 [Microbacterium chocolatum]|nr:hypothetical protein [Microbacterium chocolatum]